jgi:hypothetical protein
MAADFDNVLGRVISARRFRALYIKEAFALPNDLSVACAQLFGTTSGLKWRVRLRVIEAHFLSLGDNARRFYFAAPLALAGPAYFVNFFEGITYWSQLEASAGTATLTPFQSSI